eukprot:UN07751
MLQFFRQNNFWRFLSHALRRYVTIPTKNVYFAILSSYIINIFRYVTICTKTRIVQYFPRSSRYVTIFLIWFCNITAHLVYALNMFPDDCFLQLETKLTT